MQHIDQYMAPRGHGPCRSRWDLLDAIVAASDRRGRYYADPALLRSTLFWLHEDTAVADVERWRDELVHDGLLTIQQDGYNAFDGPIYLVHLVRRQQYRKFRPRPAISAELRAQVYERDDNRCVTCGSTDRLTLDHVFPYSRGGEDVFANLQTMCQPCNSSKGARV